MSSSADDRRAVPPRIPLVVLGVSLGLFLAVIFVQRVIYGQIYPDDVMYPAWQAVLPGFTWLGWPSFLLGLFESFATAGTSP